MKTLSDKYQLIKEGKMYKKDFLKEVKRKHPKLISNTTTYRDAIKILKNKKLINEMFLGISTPGSVGSPVGNNGGTDWFKVFKQNVVTEEEKPIKATLKKTDPQVVEIDEKGDVAQGFHAEIDKLNFNEVLDGYYYEMKQWKNKDKDKDQLLEMVKKNLEKNPLHYIEEGQFGEEGVGYTSEAPGLTPNTIKGKYISSGYGDPNKKKPEAGEPGTGYMLFKEGRVSLVNLLKEKDQVDYEDSPEKKAHYKGAEEDDAAHIAALEKDMKDDKKSDDKVKENKKPNIKARIKEIEKQGNIASLGAKITALEEEIQHRQDKLTMAENNDVLRDFINPVRVREMQKEIRALESQKGKYSKQYERLTNDGSKMTVVGEEYEKGISESKKKRIAERFTERDMDLASDIVDEMNKYYDDEVVFNAIDAVSLYLDRHPEHREHEIEIEQIADGVFGP